jgi:hypothetical protein
LCADSRRIDAAPHGDGDTFEGPPPESLVSVPAHLSNKLRTTLGREAGEELMTWLVEERAQREALRSEVSELRQEMRAGFAKLTVDFTTALTQQLHGLEIKLSERIHAVDARVLGVKADLMKWSLVFWVSAVGAIAALAGVLK